MSLKLETIKAFYDELEPKEQDVFLESIFTQKSVFDLKKQARRLTDLSQQCEMAKMDEILRSLNFEADFSINKVELHFSFLTFWVRLWVNLNAENHTNYYHLGVDSENFGYSVPSELNRPEHNNFFEIHAKTISMEMKKFGSSKQ
jgi:hypothetical protein